MRSVSAPPSGPNVTGNPWLTAVAAVMHFLAYAVVGRIGDPFASPAPHTLIVISASIVLGWTLVLSQAIEQATKVFY